MKVESEAEKKARLRKNEIAREGWKAETEEQELARRTKCNEKDRREGKKSGM